LLACSFAFGVQVIGGGITDRPVIGLASGLYSGLLALVYAYRCCALFIVLQIPRPRFPAADSNSGHSTRGNATKTKSSQSEIKPK
jgi:hypothetical protein